MESGYKYEARDPIKCFFGAMRKDGSITEHTYHDSNAGKRIYSNDY